MKTIKDLTVKVSYTVGLGDLKVPASVMSGFEKIQEKHFDVVSHADNNDKDVNNAFEWLSDNIKENDAYNHEYEIIDCE